MGEKLYKVVPIAIFVVIVGFLGTALIPGIVDEFQAESAAKGVFDQLAKQNYGKAFENIYFYDEASDLEPKITYDDAKSIWIKRVKALSEKGIFVVDYKNLSVKLDDSYPVGTVDLVFMENGKEKVKEDVSLW